MSTFPTQIEAIFEVNCVRYLFPSNIHINVTFNLLHKFALIAPFAISVKITKTSGLRYVECTE
jgi:hypothetical protein